MADRARRTDQGRDGVELSADANGRRRLFTTAFVEAGEVVVRVVGTVHREPSRYSIQVGENAHLDELGAVEVTNHSCEPSAYVDFADDGSIYLRAIRDLPLGAEVTIDYCATEEQMTSPFLCDCGSAHCYGTVSGFRSLEPRERDRLRRWLSPYLSAKYGDGSDTWSDSKRRGNKEVQS